jgi:hypothetical protein
MAPLTQSVETLQPPAHIHNGTAVAAMDTDRKRSAVNIEFILTGEKYCGIVGVVKKIVDATTFIAARADTIKFNWG